MKSFFASAALIATGILMAEAVKFAVQLGALYLLIQ